MGLRAPSVKFPLVILYEDGTATAEYLRKRPLAIMITTEVKLSLEEASEVLHWSDVEKYCQNCFLGDKKWKVPTLEQLNVICEHKKEIDDILTFWGKSPLKTSIYWSSDDMESRDYKWGLRFSDGKKLNCDKGHHFYLRLIME